MIVSSAERGEILARRGFEPQLFEFAVQSGYNPCGTKRVAKPVLPMRFAVPFLFRAYRRGLIIIADGAGQPPPAMRHQCNITSMPPAKTGPVGTSLKIIQIQMGVRIVSSRKNMLTSAEGRNLGPLAMRVEASGMNTRPLRPTHTIAGTPNEAAANKEAGAIGKNTSAMMAETRLPTARLVATFFPLARIIVKAVAVQIAEISA